MYQRDLGAARWRLLLKVSGVMLPLLWALPSQAILFDWDIGDGISGKLNTTIVMGAAWRMEEPATHLIGKANLNPGVCPVKTCQGIFQGDIQPNLNAVNAPGAFSNNADDGNLNYDKHDLTSGLVKVFSDLELSYNDFGFFGRIYAFHDEVNNDFDEFHPNRITRNTVPTGPSALGGAGRDAIENLLGIPISLPTLPLGVPTYGPGDRFKRERSDDETLRQIGQDIRLQEAYVYGYFAMPGDRELQLKLGRQTVNWGESTVAVINSLNQINPPNVNNLFRVGVDLAEVFTPVGLLYGTIGLTENVTFEGFYQYEWEPVEIPAPGSFLSFIDVGTNDAGDFINANFAKGAEDESGTGAPLDNVLALVTNTSANIKRLPDNEPEDGGQYGMALRYYAEWLNNGTELAFYAMRYHSRLPYVSFYSADTSCAKREGNPQGIDATDTVSLLIACPDLPLVHHLTGDTASAQDDILKLDSARIQLEYPEDIDLFGVSFNTSFGEWAIQGEVAYRPDLPVQVDAEDLAFAAFQPTLARCSPFDSAPACQGTLTSGPNSFTLLAPLGGDVVGASRAFPSYVLPYRGLQLEEFPGNTYIRGWETFKAFQYNIGGTYIYKPGGNIAKFLGNMDQLIFFFELAATHVPDLPGPCELPLEAPGTFTHASAGADGTGTVQGGGRVCNPTGTDFRANADGSDGLRFNPTQQVEGFPDEFSWGYRLVFIPRWESILPGVSIQPIIIFTDDVRGTAPGPGENFLEGRQNIIANVETRYKEHWSFNLGYTWFRGAEPFNQLSDRDFASAFVKYQF